jgi:hypothetical protein
MLLFLFSDITVIRSLFKLQYHFTFTSLHNPICAPQLISMHTKKKLICVEMFLALLCKIGEFQFLAFMRAHGHYQLLKIFLL